MMRQSYSGRISNYWKAILLRKGEGMSAAATKPEMGLISYNALNMNRSTVRFVFKIDNRRSVEVSCESGFHSASPD